MKIAALQMVSTPSVERNLESAQRLIAEAAAAGARLVALPEYFCFMGRSDRDKLTIAEAPGSGPIQRALADAARQHSVWVIGGTLPIQSREPSAC
jgi:nitrilase